MTTEELKMWALEQALRSGCGPHDLLDQANAILAWLSAHKEERGAE